MGAPPLAVGASEAADDAPRATVRPDGNGASVASLAALLHSASRSVRSALRCCAPACSVRANASWMASLTSVLLRILESSAEVGGMFGSFSRTTSSSTATLATRCCSCRLSVVFFTVLSCSCHP